APGVEQLDPDVGVAVRLGPDAVAAMEGVPPVAGRIEGQDLLHHRSRTCLTLAGHCSGAKPCLRNSARAMRSRPKPIPALWAGLPSAVLMLKAWQKCSRCKLHELTAVGLAAVATGTTSSYLSCCSFCVADSKRPPRPKNGSFAGTAFTSRPTAPSMSAPV